jgi:hypothetical protein
MRPSLEEERRALLEQMEASRAMYRRMLADSSPSAFLNATQGTSRTGSSFPQSRTVRWIMDHPFLLAAGVASLVWLGSGRGQFVRSRAEKIRRTASGLPLLKGLTAFSVMLLRNRARWQSTVRLATIALHWIQQRQKSRPNK